MNRRSRQAGLAERDIRERLLEETEKAMQFAIAPYSKFKVGAAIATKKGEIYTGCNMENPSLMLSVCAEKVALLKALSEGKSSFKAMAIVSSGKDYCYPCGSCRQLLWEFAKDMDIYLCRRTKGSKNLQGIKKYSLKDFLPYPFTK